MSSISITSTSSDTVDLVGLDNINADLTLNLPQPFQTEGTNTLDIKPLTTDSTVDIKPLGIDLKIEPLKTDSSIDLKPVEIDLCLTLNIGKVPNLCIRQPYHHQLGFSLFGQKIWEFSFSGEQETVIDQLAPRPQVAASASAAWPPVRQAAPAQIEPHAAGGGLRVRLGS